FLHLSRHNHAMRRPRGPGGRFLTATEIAAMQDREKSGEDDQSAQPHGGDMGSAQGGYDTSHAAAYQIQHHRQQLKQEELYQQQQQHHPQNQQHYHQRQAYDAGV
ncbi:Transcriptional activator, partial [Dissophora ornata]